MPIVIGAGVIGLVVIGIFLLSGAGEASASERKRAELKRKAAPKKKLPVVVVKPPVEEISPTPRQGFYYRIVKGDMGSTIALMTYGGDRPTARFLAVAAHPKNTVRLAKKYQDWFLPRWSQSPPPIFSMWMGVYTGHYAVIYLPFENEVPV